jgi:bla regulator protein BlaR1
MTRWMLYAMAVAALLSIAALLAEWVVRVAGGAVRWVWGVAMAVSLGLPVILGKLAAGAGVAPAQASLPVGPAAETPLPAGGLWATVPEVLSAAESLAAPLWVMATTSLLVLLVGGVLQLQRRARRWPRVRLPQGDALLSDAFGPALIAGIPSQVVLPRWAFRLGRRSLKMIMIHEEEHRRTGDVPLLMAGAVFVALVPWNPFLWFQLRRLRAAVELDCDRRVLRRGVPPVPYARLLLELGTRPRERMLPWAALAANPSLLERRLTMIVRGTKRVSRWAAAGAAFLAATLVFLACDTDAPPLKPDETAADAKAQYMAQEAVASAVLSGGPLIFLDGTRVTKAALADLDTDAIDRVEVLKDEAALELFGPEAANGVVQIFTKKAAGEDADPSESRDGRDAELDGGDTGL